jgi:hypothetical protein
VPGELPTCTTSQELRLSMNTGGVADSMNDPRLDANIYNTVGNLAFLSDTPEVEAEFGRWLEQYSAAFMDPLEEARLVEQYTTAINGLHASLCVPAML